MSYIRQGTPKFRKTSFAFFAAGFNTFAILYCVQPLMSALTDEFGVSPAAASLSLSLTTMALAISMLVFGSLSEVWGRKAIMVISMLAASVFCIMTSFSPNFHFLLVLRTMVGVSLAGLPSIAMAYLGEEIEAKSLGAAMGLYICGNVLGAVFSRVFSGILSDHFGWDMAIAGIGIISLIATLIFWYSLPPSQNFKSQPLNIGELSRSLVIHLKDPGLLSLFAIGFLLLGSNVALFNYIAFVLLGSPYSLSQTFVGWIFLVMILGMYSSVLTGSLIDHHGKQRILVICIVISLAGVCLTLASPVFLKIAGLGLFILGFFGGHAITSSWVGQRAQFNKAQASSLYLFFYYTGSSVVGTVGGVFWYLYRWEGVIAMIACFLILVLILVGILSKVESESQRGTTEDRSIGNG
ncbi:MFS transporter [Alteribacter keqinensis]|uniref:MFS transporter n=1 Tax=Alteribacter keqinensis TaxID=2483800 RepID=A0A3M7TSJ3_9BACI|nr:MFS transporter [Alteribacter keqinensis]RNA68566.1 MFS transporter [Alteribacter keqinensis]